MSHALCPPSPPPILSLKASISNVNVVGSGARLLGFKSQHEHFLAGRPWRDNKTHCDPVSSPVNVNNKSIHVTDILEELN